jgi:hypothetical protein
MSPQDLVAKYRAKGILVDTNLFVLLAIGTYKPRLISTHKRTKQYTPEDFNLVVGLVDSFSTRIVTPHILAESDNLARQMPQAEYRGLAATMAALVAEFFEIYISSAEAVRDQSYATLGLTDCSIVAAGRDALVFTDDFRLSNILPRLGRDAININHIRPWMYRT